jgi:hypothetical protein
LSPCGLINVGAVSTFLARSNISPICGKPEKLRNHVASGALAREEASQYFAYQPDSINDIFDFSEKKRPLWDVFWNHGVAALAQQTAAAAEADARPPRSISTSTAQLGTSDIPITLD